MYNVENLGQVFNFWNQAQAGYDQVVKLYYYLVMLLF